MKLETAQCIIIWQRKLFNFEVIPKSYRYMVVGLCALVFTAARKCNHDIFGLILITLICNSSVDGIKSNI